MLLHIQRVFELEMSEEPGPDPPVGLLGLARMIDVIDLFAQQMQSDGNFRVVHFPCGVTNQLFTHRSSGHRMGILLWIGAFSAVNPRGFDFVTKELGNLYGGVPDCAYLSDTLVDAGMTYGSNTYRRSGLYALEVASCFLDFIHEAQCISIFQNRKRGFSGSEPWTTSDTKYADVLRRAYRHQKNLPCREKIERQEFLEAMRSFKTQMRNEA
jgi:hypothetical protein